MSGIATAIGGAAVLGYMGSQASAGAAKDASQAQVQASQAGIATQQQQFDKVQSLLAPYVQAGSGSPGGFNSAAYLAANPDVAADPYWSQHPELHWMQHGQAEGRANPGTVGPTKGSLDSQRDLVGLNGADAQQAAIAQLQQTPGFQSQLKLGENRILANASATGGLRGGNVEAALGMFAPQLLAQTINDQYTRLGGLTSIGQNAAAGVGNAGMTTGQGISGLLQQGGSAIAGGDILAGRATAAGYGQFSQAAGNYFGMGYRLPALGGSTPVPDVVAGSNPNGYAGTMNNPSAYVGGI